MTESLGAGACAGLARHGEWWEMCQFGYKGSCYLPAGPSLGQIDRILSTTFAAIGGGADDSTMALPFPATLKLTGAETGGAVTCDMIGAIWANETVFVAALPRCEGGQAGNSGQWRQHPKCHCGDKAP